MVYCLSHEENGDIEAGTGDALIKAAKVDAAHAQVIITFSPKSPFSYTSCYIKMDKTSKGTLHVQLGSKNFDFIEDDLTM